MAHGSPSNESNIEIIFNRLNNMSREIADLKKKLSPEKDIETPNTINAEQLMAFVETFTEKYHWFMPIDKKGIDLYVSELNKKKE